MERNKAIDVVRGVGIILVILGHTPGIPLWLAKGIYAFHMPMFFILSGYLFNPEKAEPTDVVRRLCRRLLVPYFFIGFTCAIPSIATGHTTSVLDFLWKLGGTLYSIPRSGYTFFATPIWFLTCLFCVEVMYAYIWSRAKRATGLIVIVAVILGTSIFRYLDYFYPWNIQIALVAIGFFHLGTMLRRVCLFDRHRLAPWSLVVISIIYLAALYAAPVRVDISQNQIGDLLLFTVTSLTGSMFVFVIATWLSDVRVLSFFGANTVFVLGYNYWAMYFSNHLAGDQYGWIASFIIQLFLLATGAWVVRRMPWLSSIFNGPTRKNLTITPPRTMLA